MSQAHGPVPHVATPGRLPALVAWMISVSLMGTAIGSWSQVLGGPLDLSSTATLSPVVGLVLGLAAIWLDGQLFVDRAPVLNGRGQPVRVLHGLLFLVPAMLAALGILLLAFAVCVLSTSNLRFGLLLGPLVPLWAGARAWSYHLFNQGLLALDKGHRQRGIERMQAAIRSPLGAPNVRRSAATNLAMQHLRAGELEQAAQFFRQLHQGPSAAMAGVGLGLMAFVQGNPTDAERLMAAAMNSAQSASVQGLNDALRLLVVAALDDSDAARDVGRRLLGPGSGPMFRWVYSQLLQADGQMEEAMTVGAHPAVDAFGQTGLASHLMQAGRSYGLWA